MAIAEKIQSWELQRDHEGHRDYTVRFKVYVGNTDDGPESVINGVSGLPSIGDSWSYGNDLDTWARCTPYFKATPVVSGEKNNVWIVEYKFSTRPINRCQDRTISNPLREPMKISGSFARQTIEATRDYLGNSIRTTSFETVAVETDFNSPTVRIEQNTRFLQLNLFSPMVNTLNAHPLWGAAIRTVKLVNASFERKFYGTCTRYYTRVFDFEVKWDGWDRDDVPNLCRKHIRGKWDEDGTGFTADPSADPTKAKDYIRYKDKNYENSEGYVDKTTGEPSDTETYLDPVQLYGQSNFFLLGIPPTLA